MFCLEAHMLCFSQKAIRWVLGFQTSPEEMFVILVLHVQYGHLQ